MAEFEDRCGLVLVDCDDPVGGLHADPVLNGTRYSAGDVSFGINRLTGLSNLVRVGYPA